MASQDEIRAEIARLEAEARMYAEQANSIRNGEIDPDELGEETDDDDIDDGELIGDGNPWDGQPLERPKRVYPPEPPPSDKRTNELAKHSDRRCTAHRRNGEQCRKWAIYGTNVCAAHGGNAPQTRAKAMRRLAEAAPRIADRLIGLAENKLKDGTKVGAYAQVQAANSVLDRVGIVEPKQLEVTVKPFEAMLSEIESGSREDYRRQTSDPRAGELPAFSELESSAPNRPGDHGPRVIGHTPDGHEVIDAELVEQTASGDQGETDDAARARAATAAHQRATETLANPVTPTVSVQGGYMDTEQALAFAAEANREYRRQLGRP